MFSSPEGRAAYVTLSLPQQRAAVRKRNRSPRSFRWHSDGRGL